MVFFLIFLRVHMLALECSREAREAVGGEEREGYRETWEGCLVHSDWLVAGGAAVCPPKYNRVQLKRCCLFICRVFI